MDVLLKDVVYSLKSLARQPALTLVALITLALGIGANTAIFSVVNGILLRPLPYKDPEGILTIWQDNSRGGVKQEAVSPANFLDLREQSKLFQTLAGAEPYSHSLSGEIEPQAIRSWLVSAGFFETLGVQPLHGRTFAPEEYQRGNERVVVIGYGIWQRLFGGRNDLIGQKLVFNGQPHTVVGIMPAEFQFPSGRELWAPNTIADFYKQNRGSAFITVVGRLRPGVTVSQAQQEIDGIARQLAQQYPQTNSDVGIRVIPLREQIVGKVRFALLVLLSAVGLVLLIACANVANLLLVRGAARRKEFAIRAALGAGRLRLVRQVLSESLCLALLGGVGGIFLARWGVDAILALSPGNLPRADQVGISAGVLGFALAISVVTALIFGLVPALQFSRPDLQGSLKDGWTSSGEPARRRFRNLLVASEVALALVLLVGAGLLARSFIRLLEVDPGFSAEHALTLEVHVWGRARTPDQRLAYFEQSLARLRALPGVEAAGAVSALPFHDNSIDIKSVFTLAGQPAVRSGEEPTAYATVATTDYFKTLGIPLRSGRFFTNFDRQDTTPVVVVGEMMAQRYWPGEDPLGKRITITFTGQTKEREVIGVAGDVRHTGFDSEPRPEFFLPHLQEPYGSMTFVLRTAGDAATFLTPAKEAIWSVNKDQPFSSTATLDQLVSRTLAERRFYLWLLGCFAAIALVLAAVGVYGVISFSVGQRRQEIGIRIALGARATDILRLIAFHELMPAMVGIVAGVIGAIAVTRLLSSLLFDVSPTDPLTFAFVVALLAVVALVATYLPARRATKVDPLVALRYE